LPVPQHVNGNGLSFVFGQHLLEFIVINELQAVDAGKLIPLLKSGFPPGRLLGKVTDGEPERIPDPENPLAFQQQGHCFAGDGNVCFYAIPFHLDRGGIVKYDGGNDFGKILHRAVVDRQYFIPVPESQLFTCLIDYDAIFDA